MKHGTEFIFRQLHLHAWICNKNIQTINSPMKISIRAINHLVCIENTSGFSYVYVPGSKPIVLVTQRGKIDRVSRYTRELKKRRQTLIQYFRIQLDDSIWRIEGEGTSAIIKFEAAQIHFLSDVFVTVAGRCWLKKLPTVFFSHQYRSYLSCSLYLLARWRNIFNNSSFGNSLSELPLRSAFSSSKAQEKQDNQLFTCRHYNRLQLGIAQQ